MPFARLFKLLALAAILAATAGAWLIFGSSTAFDDDKYILLIPSGSNFENVMEKIENDRVLKFPAVFQLTASALDYPNRVKPGRYVIKSGQSIWHTIRQLRNGQQTPVNVVIGRWRTRFDAASKLGKYLEADSAEIIGFLSSPDSLRPFGLDTNTVMTAFVQNTYSTFWNTRFSKFFQRMTQEKEKFWTPKRLEKARALNLSPAEVTTLASIVEEETNMADDKGKIASVYLNRLQQGMRLGADPTVKFALQNFALKRVYEKHTRYPSPYNTYLNAGLPPGPICLPSIQTVDAVLDAPKTPYLFFVARSDFSGYSNFAETYTQHLIYARAYQQALDSLIAARAARGESF